ncbi:hypothetical protein [Enterobacter sp. Bisph1]|uniref:hypothetical protein n=1 Tax=Enterobacter sp. Bisph1 TaxID=1274399 RepID=UPI00057BF9DE|nr:hypothetical protein [Enterobacter sp. Bisph1]
MRLLTKRDLIMFIRYSFLSYMQRRGRDKGICFGGTLYWAVEAMRFAGKNRPIKSVLYRDMEKFYDYAVHVHDNYRLTKKPKESLAARLQKTVNMLNDQEELSYMRGKYNNGSENKLRYFLVSGAEAKEILVRIINRFPQYKNTALVIGAKLKKKLPPAEAFSHCAAILNYDNDNYFFDLNTGVYYLPHQESHLFDCDSLVATLAETLELKDPYGLPNDKHHIFIITDNKAYSMSDDVHI